MPSTSTRTPSAGTSRNRDCFLCPRYVLTEISAAEPAQWSKHCRSKTASPPLFWTCSNASGVNETAISADLAGPSPTGARKRSRWTLSPGGTTSQHHAVFQFQVCLEVSEEQELLTVDVHDIGVLGQLRQDEQFHAVLLYLAVRSSVAAGDSGIDRYLGGVAASRREGNQVDGCLAALTLNMLDGFWCQIDLHRLPRWPVAPAGLKNGMT